MLESPLLQRGRITLAFGAIPAETLILALSNTSARICSVTCSGVMSGCASMYYQANM